jgi:hypothetical protein
VTTIPRLLDKSGERFGVSRKCRMRHPDDIDREDYDT